MISKFSAISIKIQAGFFVDRQGDSKIYMERQTKITKAIMKRKKKNGRELILLILRHITLVQHSKQCCMGRRTDT